MTRPLPPLLLLLALATPALAQVKNGDEMFRQLDRELPTPGPTRAGSGAPGHAYWQQRADYVIEATLDEAKRRITGEETIRYANRSPDTLRYVWVQLDQNMERPDAEATRLRTTQPAGKKAEKSYGELGTAVMRQTFPGGYTIHAVTDGAGKALHHVVYGTMMRVDLPSPLASGETQRLKIGWSYDVREITHYGGRTGFELLKDDPQNAIFTIAQWYPRMAAYTDRHGWEVHQYLGEEFALEFGDFDVKLTVPADLVVAATGELQNTAELLTPAQRERLKAARTANKPVFVITVAEAKAAEAKRASGTRTWAFKAKRVRDFAWAASRKYAWDAMGVPVGKRTVMAMSYYPHEAAPLWSKYSTHAVAHTLECYGRYLPYPYPVALSCNGAVGGMEHPMISFQRARPEPDGTYSKRQKYGLISVVIHEVGHNWFPMIINSVERRWRWMDEGFNTFLQQIAEGYWEKDYPSRNDARRDRVLDYMKSTIDQPLMTNTSLLIQAGNNAYSKTALALTVLRESILGRERFDFAFREYCRRWAFKRPMPGDFFRTMEDAAGTDLDWFFRGWFFSTDHVDMAITGVRELTLETRDPAVDEPRAKARRAARVRRPRQVRNDAQPKRVDRYPELKDFYNRFDELDVTVADKKKYQELLEKLDPHERKLLQLKQHIYVVDFQDVGGLPMPLPLTIHYDDGSSTELRLPATLWRRSIGGKVSKLLLATRPIVKIELDRRDELADVDMTNNVFPQAIQRGTLRLTKGERKPNPMQEQAKAKAKPAKEGKEKQ